MSYDPVDRFLSDAERAARQGDRSRAMQLILLALDTASSDPSVLVRAHAVRNMLPPADEATEADAPGDAIPVDPPAPDAGIEVAVPRLRADGVDVPTLAVPSAVGGGQGSGLGPRLDAPSRPERATPSPTSRLQLPDLAQVAIETEPKRPAPRPPRPKPAPVTPPPPPSPPPRRRGRAAALYALWGVLTLVAAALVLALVRPATLERVTALFDPAARAQQALERGDFKAADQQAAAAIASGRAPGRAYVVLARAKLGLHDLPAARQALGRAIRADTSLDAALTVAQIALQVADTALAATASAAALSRGAPSATWPELAHNLELAGRLQEAANLRDLIARTSAPAPGPGGGPPIAPPGPPSGGAARP